MGMLFALWVSVAALPAYAGDSARERAQALYQEAEQAAADMRYAQALSAYRGAALADPSAPFALTARVRADDLAQHAEGDFVPLKRLNEIRRLPRAELTQRTLETFENDLEQFPPGRVRSEARLFVAAAYREHLGDRARALSAYDRALADPSTDKLNLSLALSSKVALLREAGELKAALQSMEGFAGLLPNLQRELSRELRRSRIQIASIAWLGGLLLLGAAGLARAFSMHSAAKVKRHVLRPFDLAFGFYLGGVGALLARLHGGGDVRPFLGLGLGIPLVAAVARIFTLQPFAEKTAYRAASGLICAAGVLALAFLVLSQSDAGYLESFGL